MIIILYHKGVSSPWLMIRPGIETEASEASRASRHAANALHLCNAGYTGDVKVKYANLRLCPFSILLREDKTPKIILQDI